MIEKTEVRSDRADAETDAVPQKQQAHVAGHDERRDTDPVLVMLADQQPHDDHAEAEDQRLAHHPEEA
ncbi:hypothetical protein D9M71_827180 [compost metagenome]